MYRQAYAAIISLFCIFILTDNLQAYYDPDISELDYCISGNIWTDIDRDYKKQAGESGLANVLIHLYDHTDNLIEKTITGTDGNFNFKNLRAGKYMVEILSPFRYKFSDSTDPKIEVEAEDCDTTQSTTIQAAMIEDIPVAVAVTEIELEPVANPPDSLFAMKVIWKTEIEVDTSGFNILRSHNGNINDAIQVNGALISAKGNGSTYIFYDNSVNLIGDIYYSYWLSERENDGRLFPQGPVHSFLNAADHNIHSNFLPIIVKQ